MASTNYDARYPRYNFLDSYDVTLPYDRIFKPGVVDRVLDDLDQRLVEFMYRLRRSTPYTFTSSDVFTTVVYDFYGTTSLWWLVLTYNGLETPFQIQPGMTLNFPLKVDVDAFVMDMLVPNRVGQIVAI